MRHFFKERTGAPGVRKQVSAASVSESRVNRSTTSKRAKQRISGLPIGRSLDTSNYTKCKFCIIGGRAFEGLRARFGIFGRIWESFFVFSSFFIAKLMQICYDKIKRFYCVRLVVGRFLMLYCDAHIHILPKMDNGPRDVYESLSMLSVIKTSHTKRLIATPHFDPEIETCASFLRRRRESFEELKKASTNELKRLQLLLSAEVRLCKGVSRLPLLEKLAIPNTRLVPFELPLGGFDRQMMLEFAHMMQKRKIIPVICNTERYFIMYERDHYEKLRSLPHVVFQFGTTSFSDRNVFYEAVRLTNEGRTVLLGSNAHGLQRRPPFDENSMDKIRQNSFETTFRIMAIKTDSYLRNSFL